MKTLQTLFFILIFSNALISQTDYSQLINWYYHPEKNINFINNYDLDIAVIDKNLDIDSTITITNNAEVNTGIDVFWVHPTQLTDPPSEPTVVPLSDQSFSTISATILAQGALLAKYGRFYAPRYQQATPAAFLDPNYSDSERAEVLITAYSDIKAAFLDYLDNYNNGNKIILAGHSQGSFLLAMLLRDLFDDNPDLKSKLITASLGGMPYYHAEKGTYVGGQWQNIPLCTEIDQCECIHNWRSFKETQEIPSVYSTLPIFNAALQDNSLVYRTVNLEDDWFVQDSLFYNSNSAPLRYYIAPDAGYDLGGEANFIAFDSLYTARFKRVNDNKIGLAIEYNIDDTDLRPNDLLNIENSIEFVISGFHKKDYHIYLWALMQQIDSKIENCTTSTGTNTEIINNNQLTVYPNPNNGHFTFEIKEPISKDDSIIVTDLLGRIIEVIKSKQINLIHIEQPGIYFLNTKYGSKKITVF